MHRKTQIFLELKKNEILEFFKVAIPITLGISIVWGIGIGEVLLFDITDDTRLIATVCLGFVVGLLSIVGFVITAGIILLGIGVTIEVAGDLINKAAIIGGIISLIIGSSLTGVFCYYSDKISTDDIGMLIFLALFTSFFCGMILYLFYTVYTTTRDWIHSNWRQAEILYQKELSQQGVKND